MFSLRDKKWICCTHKNVKISMDYFLKEVQKVMIFNQKYCLKEYIDIKANLRKKMQNDSEKNQYKLWNNFVFGNKIEDVRKQARDNRKKKDFFVFRTKSSYNKTIFRQRVCNRNEKAKVMNKPVYLGISILDINQVIIYEFWYFT